MLASQGFFFFAKDAKLLSVPPCLGHTRRITVRMLINFHSRYHLHCRPIRKYLGATNIWVGATIGLLLEPPVEMDIVVEKMTNFCVIMSSALSETNYGYL